MSSNAPEPEITIEKIQQTLHGSAWIEKITFSSFEIQEIVYNIFDMLKKFGKKYEKIEKIYYKVGME